MDYQEVVELLKSANRSNDMVGILPKSDISKFIIHAMQELREYKQLGTLEEVREAVERQQAISREIIEGKYFCPKCHNLMPYPGYCGCGQNLY